MVAEKISGRECPVVLGRAPLMTRSRKFWAGSINIM